MRVARAQSRRLYINVRKQHANNILVDRWVGQISYTHPVAYKLEGADDCEKRCELIVINQAELVRDYTNTEELST